METKVYTDIDFTVLWEAKSHYMEFKVLQITGYTADEDEVPLYGENFEIYQDPSNAPVFLEGSIKWDGCSNWMFPDNQNNTMLHFCSAGEAENIGLLFKRLYELASKHIDRWSP